MFGIGRGVLQYAPTGLRYYYLVLRRVFYVYTRQGESQASY